MDTTGTPSRPALSVDLREWTKAPLHELRRLVRAALHREDPDCVTDAELVVTELVSNAYDHGRRPGHLHLWLLGDPATVRIEVDDASRDNLPVLGRSRLNAMRGRGLVMVDRLSRKWGVTLGRVGKTVWAELSCSLALAT
ncbi:ATP-binding protein [Umezawaea endophytica]|uniref:ATP-binding protein n=1 Tax=Umezawaea endophytica TaxID=1654476 RepID=A0A9X2ZZW4_9PSEU|nr:ATP-binding protein [Umezawaea endophytica]MCS7477899.1 ATP-binding protein [Umezawaea endophytica]